MNFLFKKLYNKLHRLISHTRPGTREEAIKKLNTLLRNKPSFNILFVCTGNICRSAFSEACLKNRISDHRIKISSAGLYTNDALPANPKAIEIAKKFNVDLDHHRTQTVTKALENPQNIFFVFEPIHALYLRFKYKIRPTQIFYLGHFCTSPLNHILDPYNKEDKVFHQSFTEIISACNCVSGVIAESPK